MNRSFCVILLIIYVIVTTTQAGENDNHGKLLEKYYSLEKPDGDGPFPAVMLVPWCYGFDEEHAKPHYDNVQKKLGELGFVTLRVNNLAARNITFCYPDAPTNLIANDICTAAEYLRKQVFVKKGAINVVGWSWGGASVFRALRGTDSKNPAQVDAAIAFHPDCQRRAKLIPWDSDVPILVFGGDIDDISPFANCKRVFKRIDNKDKLTIRVYKNAHHGFDVFASPVIWKTKLGTCGYDENAAKAAWIEVTKFLKR